MIFPQTNAFLASPQQDPQHSKPHRIIDRKHLLACILIVCLLGQSLISPAYAKEPPRLLPAGEAERVRGNLLQLVDEPLLADTNKTILSQHYNWYAANGKIWVVSNCARIAYLTDLAVGGRTGRIAVRCQKIDEAAYCTIPESEAPFRVDGLLASDLIVLNGGLASARHWVCVVDPHYGGSDVLVADLAGDVLRLRVLSSSEIRKDGLFVLTRYDKPTEAPEEETPAPETGAEPEPEPEPELRSEPEANPFVDVKSDDPCFKPVMWAVCHRPQVTAGIDATHFGPDRTVTRAQAMTFFWAALDRPKAGKTNARFADVKKSDWFYKPVTWAVENGVTAGTDAMHFSPDRTCNRGEILTFLYASLKKPEVRIGNPYEDVTNQWYGKAALWAYANGIEKGENGRFNASTPCTRASVVTYLYRFFREADPAA